MGVCNAPNIKIYPLADNPFDNFLFYEFKSLYIPVDGIEDITPKNIIPIVDLYAKQDGKPGVPWTMRKNSPHSPYTYWHKINQCSQPLVDGLKYLMHVENRETRSPGASLLSLCDIDIEKYLLREMSCCLNADKDANSNVYIEIIRLLLRVLVVCPVY